LQPLCLVKNSQQVIEEVVIQLIFNRGKRGKGISSIATCYCWWWSRQCLLVRCTSLLLLLLHAITGVKQVLRSQQWQRLLLQLRRCQWLQLQCWCLLLLLLLQRRQRHSQWLQLQRWRRLLLLLLLRLQPTLLLLLLLHCAATSKASARQQFTVERH
jgi:hypothetical protein